MPCHALLPTSPGFKVVSSSPSEVELMVGCRSKSWPSLSFQNSQVSIKRRSYSAPRSNPVREGETKEIKMRCALQKGSWDVQHQKSMQRRNARKYQIASCAAQMLPCPTPRSVLVKNFPQPSKCSPANPSDTNNDPKRRLGTSDAVQDALGLPPTTHRKEREKKRRK